MANKPKSVKNNLKNNRGVAILMVLFAVLLMSFLAVEVSFDSGVEYAISSKAVSRLKAYYAAKSAVEMSLIRIKVFQRVKKQYGDKIPNPQMLDIIWQMPFMWPLKIDENKSTRVDREEMAENMAESFQDAQWVSSIASEGSKIDLNDLISPSEALAKSTRQQLSQLFENRLNQDDEWARKMRQEIKPEEIINNIVDWMDKDSASVNGGSESDYYKDVPSGLYPPNASFKTLEELRAVVGMTDEVYNFLSPYVTVYGIKGINVNYASKNILLSIDPKMTDEIVNEIIKRRNDPKMGPFKKEEDFLSFLSGYGVDSKTFNQNKIPLLFEPEYNFRIQATGQYTNSTREIVAITYDFDRVKGRLKGLLATPTPVPTQPQSPGTGQPAPTPTPTPAVASTPADIPKGRPNVVYWFEN